MGAASGVLRRPTLLLDALVTHEPSLPEPAPHPWKGRTCSASADGRRITKFSPAELQLAPWSERRHELDHRGELCGATLHDRKRRQHAARLLGVRHL
jgi:hypothetical protein